MWEIYGFPIDEQARLYSPDGDFKRYNILNLSCANCPQIENHLPYESSFYEPLRDYIFYLRSLSPPARWYHDVQAMIWALYFIAHGIETLNWQYNAGDGNNFLQLLNTYEIADAEGQYLFLKSRGEDHDPRYSMATGIRIPNPDFPEKGGRYLYLSRGGALQEFDWISFDNNVLQARGVESFIGPGDYNNPSIDCSNLPFGEPGIFRVRAFNNVEEAKIVLWGEKSYVHFWRRVYSNKKFNLIKKIILFPATQSLEKYPVSDIIELSGLAYHKNYLIILDGKDISNRISAEKRLWNNGEISKIFLGAINWDGKSQEDLTKDKSEIQILYWKYDLNSKYFIGHRVCDNCRNGGYIKGYGKGSAYGADGKMQYCQKISENPSAINDFMADCYQYHCNYFSEFQPNSNNDIIEYLNNIWMAQDWFLEQSVAGISNPRNFILRTSKHPSIFSLYGHFRPLSPYSYRPKIMIFDNGKYRQINRGGAILNPDYDWNNLSFNSGEEGYKWNIPEEALGQLPILINRWMDRKNRYNYKEDENITWLKLIPYFQKAGLTQDTFDLSGFGENYASRGNEIQNDIIYFSNILSRDWKNINSRGKIESGSWNDLGQSNLSGNWGVKISINSGLPESVLFKVSGEVYFAERVDSNKIKIHCKLGEASVGKQIFQDDLVRNYREGGNIVELPDYMKINNHYHNSRFGTNSLAVPGDSIHFNIAGVERKFTIEECYPCSGLKQSYTPATYSSPSIIELPIMRKEKKPIKIVLESDWNKQLKLAGLDYCFKENKQTKFIYIKEINRWQCQSCIYQPSYLLDPEKPPGKWLNPEMALAYDEWYRWQEPDSKLWQIHFSGKVIEFFMPPDPPENFELRVFYEDNSSEIIYPENNDLQIIEEDYLGLENSQSYLGIYSPIGYQILSKTYEGNIHKWNNRFQYFKYVYDNKYYIRTHRDFHGMFLKKYIHKETSNEPSLEYYDNNILGMPGLPANHREWGCKSDIIIFKDFGYLNPEELNNLSFDIKTEAVISDLCEPKIYWTEYKKDNWEEIPSNEIMIWRGNRIIFLSKKIKNEISELANKICLKIC